MKKIFNYIKTNRSKFIIIEIFIATVFTIFHFIDKSFAQLTPIKSVSIFSEISSYENEEPASFRITKSAKWISRGKVEITLKIDSHIMPHNEYTDIIFVLDTSGSMSEDKLTAVKRDSIELANYSISQGSSIALITFNDTSKIISEFTNDTTIIENSINNLTAIGNTNYYQALVNVDTILKNYEFQDNRDCVVLFLTDGLPNIDTPNEISQYKYLKNTYPDLTINAIQYEMGEEPLENLKKVSDYQYNATTSTLNKYLYKAALNPISYENFEIIDYIENKYFSVSDITAIKTTNGEASLSENKVSWNLNGLRTGIKEEMTITIDLLDELIGVGGIYPTNNKLEIKSAIRNYNEDISSTLTPILSDNYKIIYDGNAPSDCTVTGLPASTNASVFDTITFPSEIPSCEGYRFKDWEIVSDNVTKINADYFVMPEEDVEIRATWSELSTSKTMDGKVSVVQDLYQMMADNSTPDNIASEYVTSETGIDFTQISSDTNGKGIYQAVKLEGEDTPIYYYRGAVENNNLIFANFCWKIVRTTETKGIKLIYNGVPNADRSCTATGSSAQVSTSKYNEGYKSIGYNGYMYGNIYEISRNRGDIVGIGGKTELKAAWISNTDYIYSTSVTYDSTTGLYTLVNGENRIWSDTYSIDTGNQYMYTCLSSTSSTCDTVGYVTDSTNSSHMYYVSFTGGETAEDIVDKDILYGNDVTWDESTGMYTLQKTITSKIRNWKTDRTKIGAARGYKYTCFNETGVCEKVKYITYISNSSSPRTYARFDNTEFSNGVNVDTAVKQMTTESTNENSSTIKTAIDNWYSKKLSNYTDILEDTTWCDDRTIYNYGGWKKDSKILNVAFLTYETLNNSNKGVLKLKCPNNAFSYTVNDTINGNGALTYPVALLNIYEVIYAGGGNQYYLSTGHEWWTMSPMYMNFEIASGYIVTAGGGYNVDTPIYYSYGVRPSISLKPRTRSIDGDGTAEDPFVVETDNRTTISFTIARNTYNAKEGMTWYEWTTSAYKTGGVNTSETVGSLVYDDNGNAFPNITSDSIIVDGEAYSAK